MIDDVGNVEDVEEESTRVLVVKLSSEYIENSSNPIKPTSSNLNFRPKFTST
jgi:hypothetical protein